MARCQTDETLQDFELPDEFEDLAGLLDIDLKAIVAAISRRATSGSCSPAASTARCRSASGTA